MINIDIENNAKKIRIQGALEVLLTQLTFVISFLFMFTIRKGYDFNQVRNFIYDAVKKGLNKGWETYKQTEGIKGDDLYYRKIVRKTDSQ